MSSPENLSSAPDTGATGGVDDTGDYAALLDNLFPDRELGVVHFDVTPPIDTRASVAGQVEQFYNSIAVDYCNERYLELMGYEPGETLIGAGVETFFENLNVEPAFEQLVRSDYRISGQRILQRNRAGEERQIRAACACTIRDQHLFGMFITVQDITDSTARDQQLELSLQLLADNEVLSQIGAWSRNLLSGKLAQSPILHQLMDLPPRQQPYPTETLLAQIHPEDRAQVDGPLNNPDDVPDHWEVRFRVPLRNGETRTMQVIAHSVRDGQGRCLSQVGSLRNISPTDTISSIQQEQFDRHPDPMFLIALNEPVDTSLPARQQGPLIDANALLMDCNNALPSALGRSKSELIGSNADFLDRVSREHIVHFCEQDYHVDLRGVALETGDETADELWANITMTGTVNDGRLTHVWGHFKLVTEEVRLRNELAEAVQSRNQLLRAEVERQRLEADSLRERAMIASQVREGIITWDLDLNVRDWNPGAETLLGYSAAAIRGRERTIIRPDESPPASNREELLQWIGDHAGWRGEIEYRHRDGHSVLCESSLSPLTDDSGQVIALVEVIRDISERKQYEQTLAAARDAADQANFTKLRFLWSMSHEMRTPLNAVLGFAQLLEQSLGEAADSQRGYLSHIRQGGEHLLKLVNDVLDIAKIEAGQITMELEPLPLEPLCQECLDTVSAMASQREIHLQLTISDAVRVIADATRLTQVLLNLLTNGIKYNKQGGSLHVVVTATAGDKVLIEVIDSGEGIPESEQRSLFEPFYRSEFRRDETDGSGLGLAITVRLVKFMGGDIGVDSTPGQGSRFWLQLPALPAPVDVQTA